MKLYKLTFYGSAFSYDKLISVEREQYINTHMYSDKGYNCAYNIDNSDICTVMLDVDFKFDANRILKNTEVYELKFDTLKSILIMYNRSQKLNELNENI